MSLADLLNVLLVNGVLEALVLKDALPPNWNGFAVVFSADLDPKRPDVNAAPPELEAFSDPTSGPELPCFAPKLKAGTDDVFPTDFDPKLLDVELGVEANSGTD